MPHIALSFLFFVVFCGDHALDTGDSFECLKNLRRKSPFDIWLEMERISRKHFPIQLNNKTSNKSIQEIRTPPDFDAVSLLNSGQNVEKKWWNVLLSEDTKHPSYGNVSVVILPGI